MTQIKKSYSELTIPLTKMSFTPDVPSSALGPNEYNEGENVEADVRGIRSSNGDELILPAITGTPFYVTGGYRPASTQSGDSTFWFIVATIDDGTNPGKWYASNGGAWTDITPGGSFDGTDYAPATNITEAWNGTSVIFNDGINAPFFLLDSGSTGAMTMYSNQVPLDISNIQPATTTTKTITFATAQAAAPFAVGSFVVLNNVSPRYYNAAWEVTACSTTTVTISCSLTEAYLSGGQVAPLYAWNYTPDWQSYTAQFIRMYSTPNVGSILVAGNLNVVPVSNPSSTESYPVTVQWSQPFALNQMPTTWEPTVLNVANTLEVPLRGPALDGFPCNGQFFICSYWDTVVFTPINYSTTSAPILGVRLYNQGRGLLNANCWANTDELVYGVDARDIWVFDGRTFTGLGNQRVKHWFFDQLDPANYDMVYVETNTEKNQVEIYYPDSNAAEYNGKKIPNKMLSYRYDLDCWNAPRDVTVATFACESPVWSEPSANVWVSNPASRTIVYAQGFENSQLLQKDQGYYFRDVNGDPLPINSQFRRDNVKLVKDYSSKTLVHRMLPEVVNLNDNNVEIDPAVDTSLIGNVYVTVEGANSVGQAPQQVTGSSISTDTDYPWVQINQNAHRVNSIELKSPIGVDATPGTIWMCNAITWQFTEIEDDR